jgi:YegS/Rv2252/BmrU family lipid kinase
LTRSFRLLVNPAASSGRAIESVHPVRDELARMGVRHVCVLTESLDHARAEAAAARERGECVIALGGDGLVGAVAGALRGSTSALALVPSGRGNDFARKLGLPRDPRAAVRLAVEGEERLVDTGEVNGAPFVGIASVGVDSATQAYVERARLVRGRLVYLMAAVRAVAAWRHATFSVTVDGRRHEVTGYSVGVANSGIYGGGMRLVPHADIEDGRLDVITIARFPKLAFFPVFLTVFRGGHVRAPAVSFERGQRVEVGADRSFAVYADGELIAWLPAVVTIHPRSLRVIAPAP